MITLAVSVMCVKNMEKMTSMLLMLMMLGAFIHASLAVTCYNCTCADPSSSSPTCEGDICVKARNGTGGRLMIQLFNLLHI